MVTNEGSGQQLRSCASLTIWRGNIIHIFNYMTKVWHASVTTSQEWELGMCCHLFDTGMAPT